MSALAAPLLQGVYVPTAVTAGRSAAAAPGLPSVPSVETFERIVDDYQRRLYGFALRMTGNREDAEEIVQDAFVRAYRALGKMSPEQRAELRLQPWLYTITLNVTRNRLRSKRPSNVALDALADPDALLRESNEGPPSPKRSSNKTPRSRWSSARSCSCRCTFAPQRRCDSSKAAAIRRSPRSSTSRSARLNRTSTEPCAFCAASSDRKSDASTPEGAPLHALS